MDDSSGVASTSASGRTTRSQSAAAQQQQPPAPSAAKRAASPITIDDEDEEEDDEEPFEYDSDVESVRPVQSDSGMDVEEQDQRQEEPAPHQYIVISSDGEDDEHPQTPPEPVKPAVKGKLSSRKQFQADVAHLAERYSLGSNELVRGKSSAARSEVHDE